MLIIPALALLLIFAIFLIAVLRPPNRTAALLGLYLICFANIVLVGEISNSFYQLSNRWVWLGLHLLLAIAAGLVWWRNGKPSLTAPWVEANGRWLPERLSESARRWPDVWLLGAGVGLAFLFSLLLIWIVPPNSNDSLATHMARVGYWLQHSSFFPWETKQLWQVIYPINMQLQVFWMVLFLGTDRLVEIVQWLGALAAVVAVYGLARLLGANRPQAAFAGLVLATLPEIILESTTTQNDLVAGTLFVCMFYLLFLGLSGRNRAMLGLSGLALGLGLGTKQTLFFLLPGLGLSALLALFLYGKGVFRLLVGWGISVLVAFALLSAYMFVLNQVNFGHPLGPESAIEGQTGDLGGQKLRDSLVLNTLRLSYQFIDPTGLPDPLCGYSIKLKALVVGKAGHVIGLSLEAPKALGAGSNFVLRDRYILSEDAAWYGPIFALLVLPALIYQLYRGIKMKEPVRISIFLLVLSFLILDAVLRPGWDPYQGRYFIPVVMVSTPLIAFCLRPGKAWLIARLLIVAVALTVATNTFLLNVGKPLSGPHNIWVSDRISQITQQSFGMRRPTRFVDEKVPADATLGLLAYGRLQEYPLFRENFSRRLVPIYPPERVQDLAWLRAQGIEYVLVIDPEGNQELHAPEQLRLIGNQDAWTLFRLEKIR